MSDFWSRRKAAVEKEAQVDLAVAQEADRAELEAKNAEKSDQELLEELGLPDPDTLESGDDVRAFLSDAVPQRLKTRALRRLWRLNPVLANLDGLVDYGEDYTDAATVVENLQTAYQVGKGMLSHIEEMARRAEADDDAVEAIPTEPEPDVAATQQEALETESQPTRADLPKPAAETAEIAFSNNELTGDEGFTPPQSRRRMAFRFEGEGMA